MEAKTRILKGCCSCQHKAIRADGTRVCAKMQLVVGQKFRCGLWEMSYGLRKVKMIKVKA